jgi:hypothetical protein
VDVLLLLVVTVAGGGANMGLILAITGDESHSAVSGVPPLDCKHVRYSELKMSIKQTFVCVSEENVASSKRTGKSK